MKDLLIISQGHLKREMGEENETLKTSSTEFITCRS